MIKIEHIDFGYYDSEIFRDFSVEVKEGEIFTILGPNGSGKTTLLKCIEKILEPKEGSIFISGKNIKEYTQRELARTIASVPQMHRISFPYTVLELVLMGRNPHIDIFSVPKQNDIKIAEDALKEAGIYHLKDFPYTDISGGELRLSLIARALAQNALIFILDEPTAFLDFKNEHKILGKITELRNKLGLTVLMSMHDPNLAYRYSDKILLMKRLEVVAIGTPKEVLSEENLRKTYDMDVEVVKVNNETYIVQKNI